MEKCYWSNIFVMLTLDISCSRCSPFPQSSKFPGMVSRDFPAQKRMLPRSSNIPRNISAYLCYFFTRGFLAMKKKCYSTVMMLTVRDVCWWPPFRAILMILWPASLPSQTLFLFQPWRRLVAATGNARCVGNELFYRECHAAFEYYLTEIIRRGSSRLVLVGGSFGTGSTVDLASSQQNIALTILQSPLEPGIRCVMESWIYFQHTQNYFKYHVAWYLWFDMGRLIASFLFLNRMVKLCVTYHENDLHMSKILKWIPQWSITTMPYTARIDFDVVPGGRGLLGVHRKNISHCTITIRPTYLFRVEDEKGIQLSGY